MIVRTVIATCDRPHCDRSVALDPDYPQPFLEIADKGWGVQIQDDGVLTLCPQHKDWKPS
jgi:hypothetical protein